MFAETDADNKGVRETARRVGKKEKEREITLSSKIANTEPAR